MLGSGIGGLTCGAFLAQSGMRVAVLEKHVRIGGYAHSFKRRGFTFESGIHSVPMASTGLIFHMLRKLGAAEAITTIEQPEMFSVQAPDFSFVMPSRKEEIEESLLCRFPHEKSRLNAFFSSMKEFYDNLALPIFEESYIDEDKAFAARFHRRSYQSLIDSMVNDPGLRFALGSQWPYAGISPERAAALFSVMMFTIHYFEGSHYLEGGFGTLADALAKVITGGGGLVQTRAEVTRITVEGDQAASAITAQGEEFAAPLFVSNISPYSLHFDLLPEHARSKRWMRRLRNLSPSISSLSIYLGMAPEIQRVLHSPIHFWFDQRDHESIYAPIDQNTQKNINHLVFLRSVENSEKPTLTIMNFIRKSYTANWRDEKKRMAEAMINKAEVLYPGISSLIRTQEIGSPATFERYTGNTEGALYGFENTKEIYGEAKMPIITHLSNLFQTGHWGKPGGGIWNVMVNGYTAAKMILRKA